jgi:hypothetical protein
MLTNEAVWIGRALSAPPVGVISPCLNLGSSTAHFRKVLQPYIEDHIITPSEAWGCGLRQISLVVETLKRIPFI